VETAYAHAPLVLAHDRRVLDVSREERLQLRNYELLAWAKTMLPVINRSVRDTRAQLYTGHQDIHCLLSKATVATTDTIEATRKATNPARSNVSLLDIRQRFQSARTRMVRFPPIFASTSQASPTAPLKSIGYQPTSTYTND
jgi:hypothetical protein